MIEVAEELVEAVDGGQRLVAVANVVLAELAGGVAEALEQPADRGIELAHPHRRAGEADFRQPGADTVLAGEKRRAAGGARSARRSSGGSECPPCAMRSMLGVS